MSSAYGQKFVKQGGPVPISFCIKEPEMKLYRMVNGYRQQYNLPPIPLSRSLCYVASLHVKDLLLHHPDQGPCNFHSWSNQGPWKPFCYPRDENKNSSVWDKPRELTRYPAKAYEIVYWENSPVVIDTVISVWKTEAYFNSFLTNSGKWLGKQWSAIGIAIYENYACAWFGEVADPDIPVGVCGDLPVVPAGEPDKSGLKVKKLVVKNPDSLRPALSKISGKTRHVTKKVTDSLQKSVAIHLPDTLKGKLTVKADTAVNRPATYYIIVKTNLSHEAATNLLPKLQAEGYPDAKVLDKDGKIRVSVFESADKTSVMTRLKEVKKTYKDAWLLKK
jgi:hypothetical protein